MHLEKLFVYLLMLSNLIGIAHSKAKKSKSGRKSSDSGSSGGKGKSKRSKSNKDSGDFDPSDKPSRKALSDKRKHNDNDRPVDGERAFVFSWHRNELNVKSEDFRWGSKAIGYGNEFKIAAMGLKKAHPDIPIVLMTNIDGIPEELRSLVDRYYVLDLLQEAGLDKVVKKTQDLKFGFATKAQSLISGWQHGWLPEQVIHFDVDIAVVQVTPSFNFEHVFEPLQFFDIAGVMEGYSSPLKDGKSFPAVGRGWEMNTGMFAIKKSAAPLMQKWIDEFVKNADIFVEAESGEQQSFMMALQSSPEFRLFALPPVYNFRRASVYARNGPVLPVMLHSHIFSDARANESNYEEVARHAAQIIFEDSYHHMLQQGTKYRYLCDILVT